MTESVVYAPEISEPEKITAAFALMIYVRESGTSIVKHPVRVGARDTVIEPGQPFALDDFAAFDAILRGRSSALSLLPSRLLAQTPSWLVWYVEPTVRAMWFRGESKAHKLTVPWPGMVFVARPGTMYVAAYSGRARPTEDTPLYHAPLANIYADGKVCLGSAILPRGTAVEDIPGYETVIYDTLFTHPNHDRTLRLGRRRTTGNAEHARFWRGLARAKARTCPARHLSPMGRTLRLWLNALQRN